MPFLLWSAFSRDRSQPANPRRRRLYFAGVDLGFVCTGVGYDKAHCPIRLSLMPYCIHICLHVCFACHLLYCLVSSFANVYSLHLHGSQPSGGKLICPNICISACFGVFTLIQGGEPARLPVKTLFGRIGGRAPRGCPHKTSIEYVRDDLACLSVLHGVRGTYINWWVRCKI